MGNSSSYSKLKSDTFHKEQNEYELEDMDKVKKRQTENIFTTFFSFNIKFDFFIVCYENDGALYTEYETDKIKIILQISCYKTKEIGMYYLGNTIDIKVYDKSDLKKVIDKMTVQTNILTNGEKCIITLFDTSILSSLTNNTEQGSLEPSKLDLDKLEVVICKKIMQYKKDITQNNTHTKINMKNFVDEIESYISYALINYGQ
jgi:hypothetical protein